MRLALYGVILVAIGVGIMLTPWRGAAYTAIVVAGLAALLGVGRLFGRPWGRL